MRATYGDWAPRLNQSGIDERIAHYTSETTMPEYPGIVFERGHYRIEWRKRSTGEFGTGNPFGHYQQGRQA